MKKFILDFLRRGLTVCGLGPIILAVLYLILQRSTAVTSLTINEVCIGIVSLTALAFIAGGMNAIYQVERFPLMVSIFLHGSVLYVSYLVTYLLNDWLDFGMAPILVFTGIFIAGFLVIWGIIYCIIKNNTAKINAVLKRNQQQSKDTLH